MTMIAVKEAVFNKERTEASGKETEGEEDVDANIQLCDV